MTTTQRITRLDELNYSIACCLEDGTHPSVVAILELERDGEWLRMESELDQALSAISLESRMFWALEAGRQQANRPACGI